MRVLVVGLMAVWVASCAARAESSALRIGPQNIGSLQTAMTASEIRALNYPVEQDEFLWEGESTLRLSTELDAGVVEAWFFEGRAVLLRTESSRFVTVDGARVSMTLGQLRALYPGGRVGIGVEEGGYFAFMTPDGIRFGIDRTEVPDSCYEYGAPCPDLSAQRAVDVSVRAP